MAARLQPLDAPRPGVIWGRPCGACRAALAMVIAVLLPSARCAWDSLDIGVMGREAVGRQPDQTTIHRRRVCTRFLRREGHQKGLGTATHPCWLHRVRHKEQNSVRAASPLAGTPHSNRQPVTSPLRPRPRATNEARPRSNRATRSMLAPQSPCALCGPPFWKPERAETPMLISSLLWSSLRAVAEPTLAPRRPSRLWLHGCYNVPWPLANHLRRGQRRARMRPWAVDMRCRT